MSENGTGLELLGFLGGTAKSKEAEAQKKTRSVWVPNGEGRTFDGHPVYSGNQG